ncbi:MAG: 1,4-dihydroxy-2-naphthoate octaprenyltransferase [Bacteroidales bacterium]|nr:1,4-dihydroxy-2-naphthoate octaprenyltransferase [Bacteroidales bacterium]
MSSILIWIRITRPHTLFAAFSPVAIGIIVAAKIGEINWAIAIATLLAALSIQILSNFVNDYYDFKKGLDEKGRVGFKRALAEGEVSLKQMKIAIVIDLSLALLLGLYLVINGGIIILLIGLFSILFAWLYTATKKSLSYLGVADIFCFLFFGPIATLGTTALQIGEFSKESMFLGFVTGAISTCVLIVNNIRDRESDILHNKKTFVVRFGKRAGEVEYLFFIILTLVFTLLVDSFSFSSLVFLFGLILFFQLLKTKGEKYNLMLMKTGLLNVLFVILSIIDYVITK